MTAVDYNTGRNPRDLRFLRGIPAASHMEHIRCYYHYQRMALDHAHSLPVRKAISAYFSLRMPQVCTAGAWTLGGIDILPTIAVEACPRGSVTLYNIYLQKTVKSTVWKRGLWPPDWNGVHDYKRLALYVFRYAENLYNLRQERLNSAAVPNTPEQDAAEYAALQSQGAAL